MYSVAFTIFGLEIKWYGIIISFAVLVGIMLALRSAKKKGLKEDDILDFALFLLPSAIIGARIYYVIFEWEYYSQNPSQILNIRSGGLAIHGAIIAGIIVGIIFSRVKKIDFWKLADIVAPSLILGQAIGRWGNYVNKEAYGGPTNLPWGIIINGEKVHPTFLYESIWNLIGFGLLIYYQNNKSKNDGELFGLYLIFYSLGRFFIEGLRTDSLMLGNIRVAQLISVLFIIAGTIIFRKKRMEVKKI
ncbi:MAG: prolipoprotein diacylglyceryl transferase [Tissierellales bacterium]|nr:prolipoprotein diacylglyceryl transferase [Tissierellales bacterium]